MKANLLTAALLGSVLMAGPALAQTTTNQTMSSGSASSSQHINASTTGQWQASQIVGLDVYDNQNQKIGDIRELMMDKSGKVDKAVIGVGGFLGLGEHNVAVNFSDLKFSDQAAPSSTASTGSTTSGSAGSSSTGMGATTGSAAGAKTYPNHAVLSMTKDQLKAMPQYNYNK